ncbi:uncharacterized protein LOC122848521 isoform X2 [Aphidius gifuensis]|uniref:uncharacterized protein LOC122848521 isoform X2 n=1 Tax=Aphidius gifuensis TaxID=684658 RepID=UPI001CDCAD72|nr:uncharacterized protein LOC122848521 isoform X2 [Aphidius gifuensis]
MKCEGKSIESEEEKKCNLKLGKEPSLPKYDGLEIAKVNEQQFVNYDNYWTEKLACMNEDHTNKLKLTLEQAYSSMKNIENYLKITEPKKTSIDLEIIRNCYETHENQSINCSKDVDNFLRDVDKLMFQYVRKNEDDNFISNRRLTYAERFKRGF